ncbi:hypothetical protein NDU88_006065 [Pleurodeles waltl]|uniref:Uncharacterized protein n=1 Tax=Pleurodeles waltl TaxID=8319 RepID=A0AAV7UNX1_PLEWA|nr:hypothetical protein NDU88_006065 [Pleurodeles waltl]
MAVTPAAVRTAAFTRPKPSKYEGNFPKKLWAQFNKSKRLRPSVTDRSPPRFRTTPRSRRNSAPGALSGEPHIRVKDAETGEKGKPERKRSLESEDETRREPEERKGTESEENGREESGERRRNPAPLGSLKGDPETPSEFDRRHDQRRHVPGGASG